MIKKLILPALMITILGSASFSAGLTVSYEHNDAMSLTCNLGGEKMEIFKIAQKYMNTDKSFVVERCCKVHANACKMHRTEEGNSLAHLAAYAGDTALLEKLINEQGFPIEHWQLVKGGYNRSRTQLMYSAEQGKAETVKLLVNKLGAKPNTINKDEKKAIDLAKANGKTNIVTILQPFLADVGGVIDALKSGRKANVVNSFANTENLEENLKRINTLPIFKDFENILKSMNASLSLT